LILLTETQIDPMKKPAQKLRQTAKALAIQALAFIAEEPERLGSFIAATGIAPERIRDAARAPDFLAMPESIRPKSPALLT
jgi:hypothetical protein